MTGLPTGWATITIGEASGVGGLSTDGDWIESKDQDPTGSVRLIQLQDIGDGTFVNKSSRFLTEDKAEELNCTFLSPGDVLIARMPDPLGRACRFPDIGQKSVTAVDVHVWRKGEHGVEPDFLVYCVNSPEIRQSLQAQASGTTRQRVSGGRLKAQEIPLPPLPEQRRIVRKLDTLSARSTTARTHLAAIEKLVERYKLGFYLQVFAAPQEQVELGTLAKVGTGATPKKGVAKYYAGGTVPWVTSGAVNAKSVTEPSSFITEAAIHETNCKVFPAGSLLMAMYGEGKTRGQVARLGIAAATNQALAVIHELDQTRVDSEYLFRFLDSIYLEIREQAEGGVQPNLSLGKVKTFKVPLPALEEQRDIVRRIETAFAKIDRLAAEAAKALKLLGHLDQRILAKAFAGDLVPQDPTDEPAETLLARIRETRAAAPKGRRGRKFGAS